MMVIAVDPAPRKPSTIFDGTGLRCLTAVELARFLADRRENDDTLVCWDAPLTGPADPLTVGSASADYSQRIIERFFSTGAFKTPRGISVMPYCGCPHWAISRALVGLPRVGPWDLPESKLPFSLLSAEAQARTHGPFIVEVHPAVAAWLWCRAERALTSWQYKRDSAVRDKMWKVVQKKLPDEAESLQPDDDDEFDALLAYGLGVKWLRGDGSVVLLGSHSEGSFLVPASEALLNSYELFAANHRRPNQTLRSDEHLGR